MGLPSELQAPAVELVHALPVTFRAEIVFIIDGIMHVHESFLAMENGFRESAANDTRDVSGAHATFGEIPSSEALDVSAGNVSDDWLIGGSPDEMDDGAVGLPFGA